MGLMGREIATGYGTAEVYDGMLEVYRYASGVVDVRLSIISAVERKSMTRR